MPTLHLSDSELTVIRDLFNCGVRAFEATGQQLDKRDWEARDVLMQDHCCVCGAEVCDECNQLCQKCEEKGWEAVTSRDQNFHTKTFTTWRDTSPG